MLIRLPNARITTATHRIDQGRATIDVDGENVARVLVVDRRNPTDILVDETGTLVSIDASTYQVGDILVERANGCGCGGTTVTPL